MSLVDRMQDARQERLQVVQDAAVRGDVVSLVAATKELERIDLLLKQRDAWEQDATKLLDALKGGNVVSPTCADNRGPSAKARGRMARNQFIADCNRRGMKTEHIRGQVWRVSDKTVVVPYASECRPNRWFFGIPMENYDAVVLMCEASDQRVTTFVIPREFYQQHKNSFSRDGAGKQLKLNVAVADGRYTIVIPGEGNFAIDRYVGGLEQFQKSV
jgi:hypothetical protein